MRSTQTLVKLYNSPLSTKDLNIILPNFVELFSRERIIEYCLPSSDGALAKQSVKEFVMNVAARSPAPGGGSVSALLGALVSYDDSIWLWDGIHQCQNVSFLVLD